MSRPKEWFAAAAIALTIAAACSTGESGRDRAFAPSPTATRSEDAAPSGSGLAGARRGTLTLGAATQRYPIAGQAQSDIYLFDDTALWSWAPWQSGASSLKAGQGRITELTLATGATRTLYQARGADGGVALKASSDWLAWQESTDPFGQKDVRLYAMARAGGTPILIDDVLQHPDLLWLIHWCIDGADLYWTLNRRDPASDGSGTGTLMHRRLPDGQAEPLVTAPSGSLIMTPSSYKGIVAYTLAPRGQPTQVFYRLPDGSTHNVGVAPSATPAVGEAFIGFTRPEPADRSTIAVLLLSTLKVIDLAVGSDARAYGQWLSWGHTMRDPLQPDEPTPFFVARPDRLCLARFKPPLESGQSQSIAVVSSGRIAWALYDRTQSSLRLSVVIQDFGGLRCD